MKNPTEVQEEGVLSEDTQEQERINELREQVRALDIRSAEIARAITIELSERKRNPDSEQDKLETKAIINKPELKEVEAELKEIIEKIQKLEHNDSK